ncbi:hypothetical protein BKA69DRAFT_1078279 [Paraphysoderma sedebokerense]|nr:hypothetical protein BKA69DRAFT_1078279 [Paraphysoderma sedebokerense]
MTSYNLAVVMAPNLVRGPDPIKDVGICMIAQDGSGGGVGVVTRMWVEQWDVCWKSVHDKYVRA